MKVRGFWSRLRDWRSLRGSSPCQGNPLMVLMIWSCKSLSEGVEGYSDRKETELEQWALHLGVPGTVGTVPRPLEPKHAVGDSCSLPFLPLAPRRWVGGVQAGAAPPQKKIPLLWGSQGHFGPNG